MLDNACAHVLFQTLGCRLNQIESEAAARFFVDAGFSVLMGFPIAASVQMRTVLLCVVNTCAVTQKAEQKARREIRLLLEKCPNAALVVTGCYAELSEAELAALDSSEGESRIAVLTGLCKSRLSAVPEKLINFLNANKVFDAVAFAAELRQNLFVENRGAQNAEKSFATSGGSQSAKKKLVKSNRMRLAENPFLFSTNTFLSHSRASIKIQDGCGSRCSYCAIRLARGKPVSLSVSEILRRMDSLKNAGHKEIVLTGVNLAQYRNARDGKIFTFADLLETLLRETDGVSFRISSVYPEIVDTHFCKIVKDGRVRPHFHLSVQSGSDSILRAMRRNYVADDVLRAVQMLRESKPNAFFACDIIAGFPSETDADFEKTLSLLRSCKFAYVHAFPFSARRGTEAYSMKPKVPNRVAKVRVAALMDFAAQSKIAYIDSCAGKIFSAIAESKRLGGNAVSVVTENFLHCRARFQNEPPRAGSEIRVCITDTLRDAIRRGEELEADALLVE